MAAFMKGIDPDLKQYLKVHKLPEVYEALLTGLAIMCPEDPYQFIVDKLKHMKSMRDDGDYQLDWDMFIEDDMKPKQRILSESNLDYIFNFDENLQILPRLQIIWRRLEEMKHEPTPEMYERAYNHYNVKLKNICFSSWMQYHLRKRRKRKEEARKMELAILHHKHRIFRIVLQTWIQWLRYRQGRQAMAFNKIQHVYNVAVGRVIFECWHSVTLDAKRTREYFEMNDIEYQRATAAFKHFSPAFSMISSTSEMTPSPNGELEVRLPPITVNVMTVNLDPETARSKSPPYTIRLERGENMDDDDVFGKGSGEARDDISMLPNKVATRIFSFVDLVDLARCACVCRSWKMITQSSALWSKLDLTKVRHRVTDRIATKLLSKCRPYLVHLNLRGCTRLTDNAFFAIRECRNLQDLNLSECTALNDDNLKLVVESCKILLYLNISHNVITDASLRTIAKQLTNLQFLSIAFCRKFTDKGLTYLANGKCAKRLTYIDMSGCIQITPAGFANLAEGCTNIQSLILNEQFTLDELCITAMTDNCKNIQHVSLLGSPNVSDDAFKALAINKKLIKLKIESNQKITDVSFKQIGKYCHELRHLYMVDCQKITDMTLKCLTQCRNLTVVNLADCVRLTDTGVRYLVESACGNKIQELNLTNCVRVGDIALVNIHKRCHSLAYLSVCYCEHISEAGIELLGQTHSLTSLDISGCNCGDQGLSSLGNNIRLKDVNLSECSAITDLGLQKFAQQCTEIERLDLSHCQLLTDGAIKNLAFCCRMITFLNLAGCKLLTDLSVQYLSGVCHYLMHLDISGSLHITDKSLKYIKKGCKKMRVLVMLYCKGINKQAVHRIQKHIAHVEHSDDDIPAFYNY